MRGLLAIEPLYNQIVAGNKTQTRRSGGLDAVNGRKATKTKTAIITNPDDWEECGASFIRNSKGVGIERVGFRKSETDIFVECKPRYHVGEVLFLKEPWGQTGNGDWLYLYDLPPQHDWRLTDFFNWGNKMFMPKECPKRVFIRITDIKCERLLDISDEDCIAEGIEYSNFEGGHHDRLYKKYGTINSWLETPKSSFISLFRFANKINPKKEINNPWVWVYIFQHLKNYNNGQ